MSVEFKIMQASIASTVRSFRRGIAIAALAMGCALGGPHDRGPVSFETLPQPKGATPFPNWPLPPERAERLLGDTPITDEEIEIVSVKGAGGGVTGAHLDALRFVKADEQLKVKWKTFPPKKLDGPNNSPRRELAAYAVQKLFLDPEDYVVPTSAARCVSLEIFQRRNPGAPPSLERTECVLGLLSLWMSDVKVPPALYESERFRTDPTYAYFMSNFNVLTYLIGHKDGRDGNFLTAKDPKRRQVFAVDNGVAFDIAYGGIWFNWFVPNWNVIRIPAIRRNTVERLRGVARAELDALGLLVQFQRNDSGFLENTAPGTNLDPDRAVRIRDGTVQLGLKKDEIDGVWERIQDLLADVDAGRLETF